LLGICIVISSGLTGHSDGAIGRRHLGLWLGFNLLLGLLLYVMLDFDRPRRGLIRVSQAPLIELRESMK